MNILSFAKSFFCLLLVLGGAAFAFGQEDGNPPNWCRNGHFPHYGKYSLGIITAKKNERVYFYSDDADCPNGKNCRQKAYLVNGDEAIASKEHGGYRCVWFQPRKGSETVGWIQSGKLRFEAYLMEKYTPWLGEWRYYQNSLNIEQVENEGVFKVKGKAFWIGLNKNIHIGEVNAKARLSENSLLLQEDDCEVKLQLVVDYLIAADNLKCGGLNVSFSGVYRRSRAAKK